MLIRWATENEKEQNGYGNADFGQFDVLVAVDRMTEIIIGIIGFSRQKKGNWRY